MADTKTTKKMNKETILMIIDMLREVGIPANLLGYEYLKDAIYLVTNERWYLSAMTTKLYPTIADRHNSTASRVERAMRNAIDVAFNKTDLELRDLIFGNIISIHTGRPTNTEFIGGAAEYVRVKRGDYDDYS